MPKRLKAMDKCGYSADPPMRNTVEMIDGRTDVEKVATGTPVDAEAALTGNRIEASLTISQAFQYYRPAVMWSVLISLTTIMESYDGQIINSFYAFPAFQKKYGEEIDTGEYSVSANWQLGLTLASNIGLIFGVFANGTLGEKFGPRRVMMVNFAVLICTIFGTFFAPNIEVLFVGELLWSVPNTSSRLMWSLGSLNRVE
jgi:MFS transporter, SP family, general alpha glucoside:H+ symporter